MILKFAAVVGLLFWVNYSQVIPLLRLVTNSSVASAFVFYLIATAAALFVVCDTAKDLKRLTIKDMGYLVGAIVVLGLLQGWTIPDGLLSSFPRSASVLVAKTFYNVKAIILYSFLPLLSLLLLKDLPELGLRRLDQPYRKAMWWLFLMMIPLVVGASFSSGFQSAYPRYVPGAMEKIGTLSPFWSVSIYESSYLLQFFTLEVFFRGFLVFAFAKVFGRRSVWFMVILYGMLHFTKPMAEALGSLIGGYVLGVISLRSHSVFGGFLIHGGIALLMEICAWFWLLN
jgi:hypothetical protein